MGYNVLVDTGSDLSERILSLRRNRKSYNEIAQALGISKSTVSYWLAENPESKKIKSFLMAENRERSRYRIQKVIQSSREKWEKVRELGRKEAHNSFNTFLENPIFLVGLSFYWGEGDSKPKNPLRISNTDPRMVHLYIRFLKEILSISSDKIKLGLILYPDISEVSAREFWLRATGLDQNNFFKTQYIRGRHPTKRLSQGICMIVTRSIKEKAKVLEWIDIFYNQFRMV